MSYANRLSIFFFSIFSMWRELTLTFSIPRICILAIISAVNSIVTVVSHINVKYCRAGWRSKVFGVLSETEANETKAHNRIKRLTHSCNDANEKKNKKNKQN